MQQFSFFNLTNLSTSRSNCLWGRGRWAGCTDNVGNVWGVWKWGSCFNLQVIC